MLNPFKASSSLDEVVFANRNKAYGAYAIRKQYDVNVVKALSIVAAAFILLFLTGFIARPPLVPKNVSPSEVVKPVEIEFIEFSLPQAVQAVTAQAASSSAHNLNYRVESDHRVITDVPPVTDPNNPLVTSGIPGTGTPIGVPGNLPLEGTIPEIPVPEITRTFSEIMPVFNNGAGEIGAYLSKEINYPQRAIVANVSGKVLVGFDVASDGSIVNIKVLKGIGFGCDEEAVRVVSSMPRWKPGMQNGKAVPVRMTLPIRFEIQ